MRRRRPGLPAALATAFGGTAAPRAPDVVTVFAAARPTDALRAVGQAWQARGHPAPRLPFAASSALARRIEQGAPAALFLSANEAWADDLQERRLLASAARARPIGHALVPVAPADAARPVVPARGTDLLALIGPNGRIATGDPAHVPAGRAPGMSCKRAWDLWWPGRCGARPGRIVVASDAAAQAPPGTGEGGCNR